MGHANLITTTEQRAARSGSRPLDDADRAHLLTLAQRHDVDEFAKAADRWMAARDADAHEREHQAIRAKRFLTIAETPGGTHIKGLLDPVAGHKVKLALEAATAKPAADDTRDFTQRSADALETIAEHALASGTMKNGALVRPHVSLIMTETSFTETRRELHRRAQAAAAPDATTEEGSPGSTDLDGSGSSEGSNQPSTCTPATLEDGTALPISETARLLCDAEITRI